MAVVRRLLIASWLVYDPLWVSPLGRDRAGVATAISFALLLAAASSSATP